MEIKRIITAIVLNEHGVLSRISGLFAGRGYNIESLTVAPILETELSRITIATKGDERVLEQILKQLHKLIPVLKVLEDEQIVEQESVLVIFDKKEFLSELSVIFDSYNGKLVEVNDKYAIFMACDNHERINGLLKAIRSYKPKDVARSGILAIESH